MSLVCQNAAMTATVRALHSAGTAPEMEAVAATVRLLRQRRGMTLAELSANVAKQASWASRVENDKLRLRGRDLVDCAAALSVPPELLATLLPEADLEGVHFRKYRVPKKVEARATAEANFVAYLVNTLLIKAGQEPAPRLPHVDARHLGTNPREAGAAAARIVRQHWGVTSGPIRNLAGRVEADGLYIAPLPPDIGNVTAITAAQGPDRAPITLVSRSVVDDTRRFTVAHELGHLVMDAASGPADDSDVEARADAFAGELLAPYAEIRDDIRALHLSSFGALMHLQETWGLHPKAFIRRGYLAGDVTPGMQSRWFRQLNGTHRNQLRTLRSPYPLQPTGIGALLTLLKSVDWTAASLARALHVHVSELAAVLEAWPFPIGITPVPRSAPSTPISVLHEA